MEEQVTGPEAQMQTESAPTEAPESQEVQPFLTVPGESEDDATVFNSPDDVIKAFKEGTMRHSQYKSKLSEVEEREKAFAQKEADLERQLSAALEKQAEFNKINQMFKQRPDVYQYIRQQLNNPKGGNREYVDETAKSIKEELDALKEQYENDRKEREFQQQRTRAFEQLKAKYPDFSDQQVTKLMEEIESYQSLPGEQGFMNFAELLYYANKGRGIPDQVQPKKKNAPMGTTPSTDLKPGQYEGSFDDIAAQAKKEMGLI